MLRNLFCFFVIFADNSSNPLVLQDNEIPTTFLQRHGYLFIRTGLVFLCAGGAILVPRLDLVISLAGSFTSCVSSGIWPLPCYGT